MNMGTHGRLKKKFWCYTKTKTYLRGKENQKSKIFTHLT